MNKISVGIILAEVNTSGKMKPILIFQAVDSKVGTKGFKDTAYE